MFREGLRQAEVQNLDFVVRRELDVGGLEQDVELTWAEKLMEKGREEGLEVGLLKGKRETLLRQLAAKFGPLSVVTTARVEAIESLDELDGLLERVLTATSLEDMKL